MKILCERYGVDKKIQNGFFAASDKFLKTYQNNQNNQNNQNAIKININMNPNVIVTVNNVPYKL